MRNKLAVVALLVAGSAAGQSPMQSAAQGSLRYTTELEDWRENAHRLELRIPGWRLLAVERGIGLEPEFLALGLASPWCALGPLAPCGLLRELADPLGYSPGSEVFAEEAGFRLEGSLEGASRRGLWLEPFPDSLGLFALGVPTQHRNAGGAGLFGGAPLGLVQAGGVTRFRWPAAGRQSGRISTPGSAEVEALALLSLLAFTAPAAGAQDWLCERPPFPGGKLAHLAGRLRLEAEEDGRLACIILSAASGGQRVLPGAFGLCALEAAGKAWNAQGLFGVCSPDYRTPEGGLYSGAWTTGLSLQIRPWGAWRLDGSWRRKVDRPPAAPARNLPGTEEGELGVRLEVPLRAGGRMEVEADALARARYAADGGVEPAVNGGLEAYLRGKRGRLGLELRGTWTQDGRELRGLLLGQCGKVLLCVGAAGGGAPGVVVRPFGRLELAGEASLFWLSVGGGDTGKEVSLGWSVSQAWPVSPTTSTSRSRR
jgi:hypothetical protein